ncbi:Uncharacterized protein TCM_045133 [Theobroma cacao]|uniref:Uncharacterized protein n=1 Tax=Theobroma cacao TaxID=3641 RepID=A0A061FYC4_THECC|nr:Uncharacterized protein TCM_045133 [Theobroma cacao]
MLMNHETNGREGIEVSKRREKAMFGILSSMRHISFRLLVKHFLQYHPKKGFRGSRQQ